MNLRLLDSLEFDSAPNPTHSVIWLHGLGADGNDFAPLVPELKWPGAPSIRFIFPHAPVRQVTINAGMAMRAWYDIRHADLGLREDAEGILQSRQAVQALIKRENRRGVPSERILLAGFSQGCAMALYTGLRYPEKLAGLVGLSGYVPLADTLTQERHAANQTTPIFLAHGVQDPIVPVQRAQASCALLESLGYAVSLKTYNMPHSVCPEEISDIIGFLKNTLTAEP